MRKLVSLFFVLCILSGCETPNELTKSKANLDKSSDAASLNTDSELPATHDDAGDDALTTLNNAIATAKMDSKALFVHFSADW